MMPNPLPGQVSEYEEIFRALGKARVRYLVVGGVAVMLHGVPRVTADLDLMPDFEEGNMLRLVKALAKSGLRPMIPESPEAIADPGNRARWVREKHMIVLRFQDWKRAYRLVDVFVRHPVPFERAYARRLRIPLFRCSAPVASARDLIAMKRKAGRDRDLYDIAALRRLAKA